MEYIDANNKYMTDMFRQYPDLKEMQKVQNPRMIAISSRLPSLRTRYPKTTSTPGSTFILHLPRGKNGSKIEVAPHIQVNIMNQVEYPLMHAVEHYGKSDKAAISRKHWMKKWLALPDHKIIVAQTQSGLPVASNIFEYFS